MPVNSAPNDIRELPGIIPLFPLVGVLLLPRCELPLQIFEPRYLAMIDASLKSHRTIGMVQPKQDDSRETPRLEAIGCAGKISAFAESGDGRYLVTLTGVARFRVDNEIDGALPFRNAAVNYAAFTKDLVKQEIPSEISGDEVIQILNLFEKSRNLKFEPSQVSNSRASHLLDTLCMKLPLEALEKQALLEASDVAARAKILFTIAKFEVAQSANSSSRMQ